ncbi:MAG: lipid-A-disaccharide synthase [Cyanobacteriota bacterium]|nr:lipid-A-disaccharide synthase [Cyanobacteriota bacterium]
MNRKIFISTGEVSGDLQGALLIEALYQQARTLDISLEIAATGGDRMAAAGANLLGNTSDVGSVGLLESLPFVLPAWQLQRRVRRYLQENPPDLVVLIDYMGPNLDLGTYIKAEFPPHIPVVYYIAPQAWVWSLSDRNTQTIARISDRLLAIFPEEARFFEKRGVSVSWVGHPLVDLLENASDRQQARDKLGIAADTLAIALLPASRHQELKYLMPVMFEAARQLQEQIPQVEFWIPLSLETYRSSIERAIADYGLRGTLVGEGTRDVLAAADLAIAKSGTVNLELALLGVPQVVLYRVHPVTAWIARKVLGFDIPFMSPPNLVEMKSIVPELLQEEATAENIVAESRELLFNRDRRERMQADYQQMQQAVGSVGAANRAAREIFELLAASSSEPEM